MELLQSFPLHSPPVVVVQHIGAEFARSFAKRLAERSGLALGDPESAEPLQTGTLYMALRDHHLHLAPHGHRSLRLETRDHDKVNGHRPSVDVLFRSASLLGVDALAVLLTGMGKDGAEGLKDLYQGGRCLTMAQDASSSVVFGMPKAAIETGTVSLIGDLAYLRRQIEEWIRK
jgi:two-component system chemotaxis response regulator CheB